MSSLPTAPHTFAASEYATSTNLDTLSNNLNFLLGAGASPKPYVYAYATTLQAALTAGTTTLVVLDFEVEDSDGMHGATGTLTIVTPGVYDVRAVVGFGPTTSGQDQVLIEHNGTSISNNGGSFINAGHRVLAGPAFVRCAVGDTIQLFVNSTVSNTLEVGQANTWMQAMWMRE